MEAHNVANWVHHYVLNLHTKYLILIIKIQSIKVISEILLLF